MKMKRKVIKYLFLFALPGLFACAAGNADKLMIEIPGKPGVDLAAFEKIVLTHFLVKDDKSTFDINQDFLEYFSFELGQNLDKEIETRDFVPPNIESFDDAAFWRSRFPKLKKTLLFTGNLSFREESRKALLQKKGDKFETPFEPESKLAQQRFFAIEVDIALIDTATGNSVFNRNFKERRTYNNTNQTSRFAYYDLMQVVKDKLLQDLGGKRQNQDRYLISK